MIGAKEKPATGGNHLANLAPENAAATLAVLTVLERIATALEKNNEVLAKQNKSLVAISDALFHLKEA